MKTAAAYIRVSTGDQLEFSPDSQLKAIRDYALKNQLLLSEEHIYMDEGISGRNAQKRPGFMAMIAVAKSSRRPFDVILIWKFSRFARNREDSIVYKSMLRRQCGIEVLSVSEQLGEDKTSILIEALLEAMDEYYSINLAEEVTRGMTEKASRGGVVSTPPFGYFMQNKAFVPEPAAAPVVEMAFAEAFNGMSPLWIAKKLNNLGQCTRRGKPWESRTVLYMLLNPVYAGWVRWKPRQSGSAILARGKHTPLVSQAVFDTVQEKLYQYQMQRKKYEKKSAPAQNLFKGLVVCSACGRALVLSGHGDRLQCSGYSKGKCTHSHSISLAKVENAVFGQLEKDFSQACFSVEPSSSLEISPDEKLVAQEELRLQRIQQAFEAGVDSLEEYRIKKQTQMEKIQNLKMKSAKIPSTSHSEAQGAQFTLSSFLKNTAVTPAAKNHLLQLFIRQILYKKNNHELIIEYRDKSDFAIRRT